MSVQTTYLSPSSRNQPICSSRVSPVFEEMKPVFAQIVADVCAEKHTVGAEDVQPAGELGRAQRGDAADDGLRGSCIEYGGQGGVVGYAAAPFDLDSGLGGHLLEGGEVHRLGAPGTVEVHHVDPLDAAVGVQERHLQRGGVIDLGGGEVALGEADAASVDDVDSRDNLYHNPMKFFNIRSPTAPLFSGWNCVP